MSVADDPVARAMLMLAGAGYHSVKITATSASGVKVVMEGGAPKPKTERKGKRGAA